MRPARVPGRGGRRRHGPDARARRDASRKADAPVAPTGRRCPASSRDRSRTDETRTPFKDITTYNNFYEFGTDKSDPAENARPAARRAPGRSRSRARSRSPQVIDIDDAARSWFPLEERVYRLRCVEAWSMVIPWVGFPLGDADQAARADVAAPSTSRSRPARARADARAAAPACSTGPTSRGCAWTRRCTRWRSWRSACTARVLPNQNGAPLRLVVPWKYGFKGIKSIVKIRFVETQPPTTLEPAGARRVRLLLQREPGGRSPALEPGSERRIGELVRAQDAAVQRLRRARSRSLYAGHGPARSLLSDGGRQPARGDALAKLAIGVGALRAGGAHRLAARSPASSAPTRSPRR